MITDMELLANVAHLRMVFQDNRTRHGRPWEKIYLDRVGKLLPELTEEDVFIVIQRAIELEILESCDKLDKDTGQLRPALKLVKFEYRPSR